MGGLHPQPGVNYPAHFKTMETNDDLMFHHSLMDAERAKRRCDTAAPVAIQQVSPAQHEVWRITAAAEVYRVRQQFTLSTQAYKAAADLQVIIWRL